MNLTTYFKNAVLNYFFGLTPYVVPTKYYVGLLQNMTTASIESAPEEHSGDGYDRVEIDNNKVTFSVSLDSSLDNEIPINFPVATGGDWGNQYYFGLFDDTLTNGGNLLAYGQANVLTGDPALILEGQQAQLAKGSLTVT